MRRISGMLLVIVLLLMALPVSAAPAPVTVQVNGVPISSPVAPEIVDGTTLVPVRAVAQAFGAQVGWNAATHTVSLTTSAGTGMDAAAVFRKVSPSIVGIVSLTHDASGTLTGVDTGSGVVIGPDGLIVTNAHVLAGGDTFYVVTGPGHAVTVPASHIWSDSVSDLAFLRSGISNLPPATLGNSDEVAVGEPVIAIGNPLGYYLKDTITRGIISGVGRDVSGASPYPLLQTDASINPGNSGGALVDASGAVVGITSLKFATSEVQGLGFAIPTNVVRQILQQFQQNNRVIRPWLGVTLKEPWQDSVGLPTPDGLTVTGVVPGAPADQAGVQAGDQIMAVGGTAVHTDIELTAILWAHKPGEKLPLTIKRNGQTLTVTVTLAERPQGQ